MLSVREIQEKDIDAISAYWLDNDPEYLVGMGVDLEKLPRKEDLRKMLLNQLAQPIEKKQSYCIIWQYDGEAIGHSNVNDIVFGKTANMHLHMWKAGLRKKGMGTSLLRQTIPYFFDQLQLKNLYSEPYALNTAPSKTLEKIGFQFIKKYKTIPSSLSFEQEVNRWELSYEAYLKLSTV